MRYLIAGGGTAGHINPGIAIAKEIKKNEPGAEILFIGTKKGLEASLIPREGFNIKFIDVQGFKRRFSYDTFKSAGKLIKGLYDAHRILKEYRPDIVIGTGGYVCGPVVYLACRKKIPALIHEQNAFPGITNRILSRYVDVVAVSFKNSKKYFSRKANIIHTGNPIREELLKSDRKLMRQKLKISDDTDFVVIFGGSLGAEKINNTVVKMICSYMEKEDFRLIFATGEKHYDFVIRKIQNAKADTVECVPYIYNMDEVLAAADLAVCRAGAITLSELTALGIPSILIPSPYVSSNHQEHNARLLEEHGAAVVILESDLTPKILISQIRSLLSNKNILSKMSKSAKVLGITNASEKIYRLIKNLSTP